MAQILIVDDDIQLLELMSIAFRKSQHEVTTAIDGKKALAKLREQTFDVVITDIIMPEADGIELLSEISKMRRRPAIIAISGGSQRIHADLLLAAANALKADIVIQKPVTPRQLLEATETLLVSRGTL